MLDLPYDQFDEWYVFAEPNNFGDEYEVFINYSHFSLEDPSCPPSVSPPVYGLHDLQRRFWKQVVRLAPEFYLAVDGHFIFVSRDADAYCRVEQCIRSTVSVNNPG